MELKRSDEEKYPTVFLTYASEDKEVALKIVQALQHTNTRVLYDALSINLGDSVLSSLKSAITASDYVVVIFSRQSNNNLSFMEREITSMLDDFSIRGITLLPIKLDDSDIPAFLSHYQYLDLHDNFDDALNKLVEYFSRVPDIDFQKFNYDQFEELVKELLVNLGFQQVKETKTFDVDIVAEYTHRDPFGVNYKEVYLVDAKLYRQSRADLKTLNKLVNTLKAHPSSHKAILVTNSKLTSAAIDWLQKAKEDNKVDIRIIDGTELKRLLLQHVWLIKKYFSNGDTEEGHKSP